MGRATPITIQPAKLSPNDKIPAGRKPRKLLPGEMTHYCFLPSTSIGSLKKEDEELFRKELEKNGDKVPGRRRLGQLARISGLGQNRIRKWFQDQLLIVQTVPPDLPLSPLSPLLFEDPSSSESPGADHTNTLVALASLEWRVFKLDDLLNQCARMVEDNFTTVNDIAADFWL